MRHEDAICRRLPATATKEERHRDHRERMHARHAKHARWRGERQAFWASRKGQKQTRWIIRANVSSAHPDYGMTHAENAQRQAFREMGE